MIADTKTTRERILDEAARLIHTRGFRGMSISELLEVADISKGSLYFHFKSKRELGIAVLERAREEFMDFLDQSLAGDTPKDGLFNFFDRALAEHNKMQFVGGCLWGNMALEVSDSDDRYSAFVAAVFDEWTEMIRENIIEGRKAGQFRADISARGLARHIVSAIEGGIMQSRLKKDEAPLRENIKALKLLLLPVGGEGRPSPGRR